MTGNQWMHPSDEAAKKKDRFAARPMADQPVRAGKTDPTNCCSRPKTKQNLEKSQDEVSSE